MKKIIYTIFLTFILLIPTCVKANEVTLHLFYRDGCPHCAEEKEFFKELKEEYPNLKIKMYEIWNDTNNAKIMDDVSSTLKENINGVPYTIIGTYSSLGFNEFTKNQLKDHIDICYKYGCTDLVSKVIENNKSLYNELNDNIKKELENKMLYEEGEDDNKIQNNDKKHEDIVKIPIIGNINLNVMPLFLTAIIMGTIDGFNPCAMWVLIFLISMMLTMKNRKRMWVLGITFLTTSAFIYFLFMVAWLKITLQISQVKMVNLSIALIALIGGAINVRSYIKTLNSDIGCEIVDNKKRKSIPRSIPCF